MSELWAELGATSGQHAALSRYLDLLMAANQRMNLTRITDRASAELQHIALSSTLGS